jgi:serine/threonine protein kinase
MTEREKRIALEQARREQTEKMDDSSDRSIPDSGTLGRRAPESPKAADSWATWAGSSEPPKVQIGRYTILHALGSGGMGVVYKALDPQLQRPVAIKVPRFDGAEQGAQKARLRFLREARAAAAIRHPHVCPIHDVGEQEGVPYVVMAFVEGYSLAEQLAEHGFADCRRAVRLAREIAEALAAVHAHGIIHRDLKPGNILLDGAGQPLLTDFGLSRFERDTERLTEEGALTGTPAYMAPEQARRGKVDARSDLFSLGTVLYEIFTGQLPFKGDDPMAQLTALALLDPTPPAELNPNLPPDLAELVMQLLTKDPEERPESAQEVVERLQLIERSLVTGKTLAPTIRSGASRGKVKSTKGRSRPNEADTLRVGPRHSKQRRLSKKTRRPLTKIAAGLLAVLIATAAGVWLCSPSARSTTDRGQSAASPHDDGKTAAVPAGKASKPPLKVVLLAGQSNMSGRAAVSTLDYLGDDPKTAGLLAKIKNSDGSWKVRDNVWVSFQRMSDFKVGRLTVGYGESDREIGPELLFGHELGDAFENPILLVKVTQGPMSLGVEARPPSSGGVTGAFYKKLIDTIRGVLANPKDHFPLVDGQGCELAGFVWFQGWNDHLRPELRVQYEVNLANLIRDVRLDLGVPKVPVVIGEEGVFGKKPNPDILALRLSQTAAVRLPEFAGNVTLVKTSEYWDEATQAILNSGFDPIKKVWRSKELKKQFEKRGSNQEFFYLGSGKILAQVGQGFAEAMKEMWRRQAGGTAGRR